MKTSKVIDNIGNYNKSLDLSKFCHNYLYNLL